jgi:ribosomal protein S21
MQRAGIAQDAPFERAARAFKRAVDHQRFVAGLD